MGNIKYADKGNMTKAEIDKTIDFLIKAKKAGQFRAFWKTFDESVNLMASGEVVIQSMWSPAVAAVRSKGIPCNYQPLKEGYRAWGGGLGLAKHLDGRRARRGLRIHQLVPVRLGRRLSQPPGLLLGRLDTAKQFMSRGRVGLLDRGQAGAGRHHAPDGKVMEKAGAVRDGGSFDERMGHVACWNSVMDEDRYMVEALERVHRGVDCNAAQRHLATVRLVRGPPARRVTSPDAARCERGSTTAALCALSAGGAARADPRRLPAAADR